MAHTAPVEQPGAQRHDQRRHQVRTKGQISERQELKETGQEQEERVSSGMSHAAGFRGDWLSSKTQGSEDVR